MSTVTDDVLILGPPKWAGVGHGVLGGWAQWVATAALLLCGGALALVVLRGNLLATLSGGQLIGLITLAALCVALPSVLMPMTPVWLRIDRTTATITIVTSGWAGWTQETLRFDAIASIETIGDRHALIDNQGRSIELPTAISANDLLAIRSLIGCTPWSAPSAA
jgi:hypothetical protein